MPAKPSPAPSAEKWTVLVDGDCVLCNGFVRFVVQRDPAARFVFFALDSSEAHQALASRGLPAPPTGTVVLLNAHRMFVRSTAVLMIADKLGFPWSLLRGLLLIPQPLRDAAYIVVARLRYRLMGRVSRAAR